MTLSSMRLGGPLDSIRCARRYDPVRASVGVLRVIVIATAGKGLTMRVDHGVVVGLDNGGTSNNATVLDASGAFLVDRLVEVPSRVLEGPDAAVEALVESMEAVLAVTGVPRQAVRGVGLDSPGPASAEGIISSRGATNFNLPAWHGYDFRGALEQRIGIPVIYNNDGNAAALYAHYTLFGKEAGAHSSVSAIVGTGLGGGVVEAGRVIKGAAGMAGELGHIQIPMDGLLAEGQPMPRCNCGLMGDVESIASLTGIVNNLLPYWLSRYADHELAAAPSMIKAARLVRGHGERGDGLARRIFEQQAIALGRLFSIAANFTDPSAYFVGGGVVEAAAEFRDWFLETVRANTVLRDEQAKVAQFALVPDLDMAGARGAAVAALAALNL
jgi:glucokinase